MGIVTSAMSISLDGYVGIDEPDRWWDVHNRLHRWVFALSSWRERQGLEGGESNVSSQLIAEQFSTTGAYVLGRNMFDFGVEPWGEDPPFRAPVFVVTNRGQEPIVKGGGTSYTFVTEGVEAAIEQARAAAGDRDVFVSGGASIVQQCIKSALLDELHLHQSSVLLGAGIRLWDEIGPEWKELQPTRVIAADGVTHLYFRFNG